MTPLMMLALTLPPSLAFVSCRLIELRALKERQLNKEQEARLSKAERLINSLEHADNINDSAFKEHSGELKRLNEQLTTLQERVYRT